MRIAVLALDHDMSDMVTTYKAKRDLLCSELADTLDLAQPEGAFYMFAPAPAGRGSAFVERAIKNNCLVIPGHVFSERDSHFRISYAASDADIRRGCRILRELCLEDA